MTKSNLLPFFEATFAAVVWGASFIATKVALKDVSPITIVWLRFGMGLLVLGAAVALRKEFSLPKKNEWGYFALLGFLGITFHQWLQSNGLQTSEAGTTAWIVATTPVFMAILGWLILKEGLSLVKIFGNALAFFGVLLVVSDGNLASISIRRFGRAGRRAHPRQCGQLGGRVGPFAARTENDIRKSVRFLYDAALQPTSWNHTDHR